MAFVLDDNICMFFRNFSRPRKVFQLITYILLIDDFYFSSSINRRGKKITLVGKFINNVSTLKMGESDLKIFC